MTNKEVKVVLKSLAENPLLSAEHITEALYKAIELVESQPCEDCISRKEVLEYIDKMPSELTLDGRRMVRRRTLEEYISDTLPSVTPTRTKGKWIQTKDECDGVNFYDFSFECTKCGKEQSFKSNYCPNCGAYMRESGDDE